MTTTTICSSRKSPSRRNLIVGIGTDGDHPQSPNCWRLEATMTAR
jgi:hypothetical protein